MTKFQREIKDQLISYEQEMKNIHGPEYLSWEEEAQMRIDQLKDWLSKLPEDHKNRNLLVEEMMDLQEILQESESRKDKSNDSK